MLSIRMRRAGSKKRASYRVVVTEESRPREGSFLEILGYYNPRTRPARVDIDRARVQYWIARGAKPSDSVRTLLARHLTRDRGAAAETPEAGTGGSGSAG
jgi:small subunit ribosomal protein S16